MNVIDDHFDREMGASGAAHCGMLVTAMLMIMQKRLPGSNGQSETWTRSIVMKRAVEGERDRADRPVGAVDVKLAVHGGRSELMLAAGLRRYHDPAFPMALSLAELLPGDEPRTPAGHVPYGRGALGDPDDQVAMAVEKAVGRRAGVGLQLAVAPAAVADVGCPLRGAGSASSARSSSLSAPLPSPRRRDAAYRRSPSSPGCPR